MSSDIQIQRPNSDRFSMSIQCNSGVSPADASTYYLGLIGIPIASSANISPFVVPRDCTLVRTDLSIMILTSAGTSETFSSYVRTNNTTDNLISSSTQADQAREVFTNSAMNVSLSAGDSFELKLIFPTWVTNPQGVYFAANLYFR